MGEVLPGLGMGSDTAQLRNERRANSLQMWGGAFQCQPCAASWCRFGRGLRVKARDSWQEDAGGWVRGGASRAETSDLASWPILHRFMFGESVQA